jgi:hypothetical protein
VRLPHDKTTAGFLPEACDLLMRIEPSHSYHVQHHARPPSGSYSISLGQVHKRFRAVLQELRQLHAKEESQEGRLAKLNLGPLIEGTDGLLDSLLEHLDDCLGVLRLFFEPGVDFDKRFAKSLAVRSYRKAIDPYRNYVGHRVNHLKHAQGRLRPVAVFDGTTTLLGYFFEGVRSGGVIGPHEGLHRQNDVDSYAYTMRFHLYHVYSVGRELAHAVSDLAPIGATGIDTDAEFSQKFAWLVKEVAGLPRTLFPGEDKFDWPEVTFQSNRGVEAVELRLVSAASAGIKVIPSGSHVHAVFESDGISKTYHLPLWRSR